ncbi:S1/P1 nuclease [Nonlabens sp. Hel1_33_55]|uniref:S1/P1 nuclease n=1 Tax=Nonlabens sp. Hel1_33_55 TaxID=1336802 RepID=UPI000B0DB436|nr:S1/P1 nuclease [Nonlabens sp. Hel1_33_55]
MRYLILAALLLVSTNMKADDWGQTGHRVTGAIAQKHLNRKAKKAIADLLDGESLAFVSTYADEIKSDGQYRSYGPWHYVNVPFDQTYETHEHNDEGDVIQGIDKCIEILKSETATKADKAFHLRLLVHFVGDLHQPMHVGIAEDKGGNDFQVRWFNDGTNLHSVWDTRMIESYGMSYTELANNVDDLSKEEYKAIASGTHRDWMEDSRVLVKDIYQNTEVGEKLGYRYMYDYFSTVRKQLQKGGIRLAAMLNELLG